MNIQTLISVIPHTSSWSVSNSIIMITCNLLCIGLGRYAIKVRGLGPSIPTLGLQGFGLPELLATTSLGHIIGAGAIIGLSSIRIIN
uniref:Photosystem I reaction center subunit PsaK n=1 Tax=Gracilaria salicornia TaxID=172968 RepID=W8DVR9_9FLOR|nr:photosystem I reaction center subunit X [Gracilaria salicornia]AHH24662.1 photosystem I reaction center subunit X [Gracilaria salicornia]UAD87564.1 photosystem I reaction center subunit X [Gracilaria salicornia]